MSLFADWNALPLQEEPPSSPAAPGGTQPFTATLLTHLPPAPAGTTAASDAPSSSFP